MAVQGKRGDTLSKAERLCSERRIEALFNGGRRGGIGPLRFCYLTVPAAGNAMEHAAHIRATREDAVAVSVLFSVPKNAFRRAWKRNLIKRRMRESYRRRKHELVAAAQAAGHHIDIAFICLPSADIPDFATLDGAISKILDKIVARG